MKPLASTSVFNRQRDRTPVREWPLDRILALSHTANLRARYKAAVVEGRLDRAEVFEAAIVDALERDEWAALLPVGCWCFGFGGMAERALMLPGPDVPMVATVYCHCAVGQARRVTDDELRQQAEAYAQQTRVAGIWDGARVPERFASCSFATFPVTAESRPAVEALRRWLDGSGWCIVLQGQYGVGKTGLAISALREAAERRHAGLFVKAPDLLARIRATYDRDAQTSEADVLASLREVAYLVLDDIGAERTTDWATEQLFSVLDRRHDTMARTIITTNLDLVELAVHMRERTFHRFEEDTTFVMVTGPNLRRNAA